MKRTSFAAGACAAVGLAARPRRARPQTLVPLRVAGGLTDSFAEGTYAAAGGFFRAAGLDVSFVTPPNSAAITAAVAAGAIDVGVGSPLSLALAVQRGLDVRCLAPGALFVATSPTMLLMIAKDSGIKTASDLAGKTVAADNVRGITEAVMSAWLRQQHVDPRSVRYVELPYAVMGAAVAGGRVAAAMIAEPALTAARALTVPFANPQAALGRSFYVSCWFARAEWLRQQAPAARAFQSAISRTANWANAHRAETAAMFEKITTVPHAVVMAMTRCPFAEGALDPALLQPQLDAAVAAGLMRPMAATQMIGAV